ncbi:MAG: hypothetical protein J7K63_03645 [Candidatus Marinimicrobia bacterium]|nr:hypothetical protein [Candidatus Neomarinimicrobiota bacterium]
MRFHRVVDSGETKEKNRYFEDLKAGIIRAFVLALIFAASLYIYTKFVAR